MMSSAADDADAAADDAADAKAAVKALLEAGAKGGFEGVCAKVDVVGCFFMASSKLWEDTRPQPWPVVESR